MKSKSTNFIALDIGSSKISALAANIGHHGKVNIFSQILHYCVGFKSGSITDIEAVGESLVGAIYALEKECGKNIKEVNLSISGAGAKSYYLSHKIKIYGQTITKQDLKRLLQKAIANFSIKDKEIIHYFPIEFTVDQDNIVENPVGIQGKELACQLHIIAANSSTLNNVTKCLAKSHIEVAEIMLSTYTAAIACLSEDEKKLGAIFIEMGSHTTSMGIFLDGNLVYTTYVPIGGFHITSDIAKAFSIRIDTAEKLKILYGSASPEGFDKENVIRLEEFEPDNGYDANLTINASQLSEVIQPRIREILESIRKQFDNLGMDNLLARSVVVTGGGAGLGGVKSLVAKIFNRKTRVAKPEAYSGFSENYNPYIYSSVIGIVKEKAIKIENNDLAADENAGIIKKIFVWIKENI